MDINNINRWALMLRIMDGIRRVGNRHYARCNEIRDKLTAHSGRIVHPRECRSISPEYAEHFEAGRDWHRTADWYHQSVVRELNLTGMSAAWEDGFAAGKRLCGIGK